MDPVADLARPFLAGAPPADRVEAIDKLRFHIASKIHGRVSSAGLKTQVIEVEREGEPMLAVDVAVWRSTEVRGDLAGLIRALFEAAQHYALRRAVELEQAQVIVVVPDDGEPDLDGFGVHLAAVGMTRLAVCVATERARWYRLDGLTLQTIPGIDAAVRHLRHGEPPAAPVPAAPPERPLRVLLVADEWRSGTGGISTINRELGIALARAGVDVRVVLPDADRDERALISADNVRLVLPEPIAGLTRLERLLTPAFADGCQTDPYESPHQYRPYAPDVIVGHGRILGPYALAIQRTFFPRSLRLHIVHTDADRLEDAKEIPGGDSRMATADARRALELDLALSADLVAGVGPLLAETITDQMLGAPSRPPVLNLVPGLRDWNGTVDPEHLPSGRQILLLARAEDISAKGIDLAVAMLQRAADRLGDAPSGHPRLVIRGVRTADDAFVKRQIEALQRAAPDTEVIRRPYSTDLAALRSDLWSSRVVIMPSRHEGFGLAAYEAIAAGVPVRITSNSGLARLLTKATTDAERPVPREVVSMRGTDKEIGIRWGDALADVLIDPKAEFLRAQDLRTQLLAKVGWPAAVADLLRSLPVLT